jgi:uncharacterized protein (DUF2147 family)
MKSVVRIVGLLFAFMMMSCTFAAGFASPEGYWKTIDDVTGKPKAIVEIAQGGNGQLSGRILKVFPRPGQEQNPLCTACKGSKHNQRVVGMTILEGLKQQTRDKPNLWTDGKILDPKNGKVYTCQAQLLDGGQKLLVRGYVGLPMFGRSQTWIRVGNPRNE